jgi:hypothetical protein
MKKLNRQNKQGFEGDPAKSNYIKIMEMANTQQLLIRFGALFTKLTYICYLSSEIFCHEET